jgi:tetratricopeptide (TPR) repeat protein
MKISMVLIAKDEAKNIKPCFDTFWDDVDEVVLVDTGSSDDTLDTAKAYAKDKKEKNKLVTGTFEWCDDFSAARNYADSLATGDWLAWADLDDNVIGIPYLRKLAQDTDLTVNQFFCVYDYAVQPNGNVSCQLKRERLVRKSSGKWAGRVHECQQVPGPLVEADPSKARWVHRLMPSNKECRNEKILKTWVKDISPDHPDYGRIISYIGTELMGAMKREKRAEGVMAVVPDQDKIKESAEYFEQYLTIPGQAPDMRAQIARRYAQVLMGLGENDKAIEVSLPMIMECPSWPDTYLTLSEVAYAKEEWDKSAGFASQVIQKGKPDTMLIINPEDYDLKPYTIISSSLAQVGNFEDAVKSAQKVVEKNPDFLDIQVHLNNWLGRLLRDQTAITFANCSTLLREYDEPEKAHMLLQCVPFFCQDHETVIASKVLTQKALNEPYKLHSLYEDEPRSTFLIKSLTEFDNQLKQQEKEQLIEEIAV